jgi:hypothetical protein
MHRPTVRLMTSLAAVSRSMTFTRRARSYMLFHVVHFSSQQSMELEAADVRRRVDDVCMTTSECLSAGFESRI